MAEYVRDGIKLYYEVKGTGKPIIFTHGASWNYKQWRGQVDYFSNFYQTIVWDVRGHGYSTLPAGKIDSEDFSKDLIGLMDHLNIESAALCGLSMGGHISLQTAIRHPERVDGLILIGTPFTNAFNRYEKIFVPINRWSSKLLSMKLSAKLSAAALSKFNSNNRAYIEEAMQMIPYSNWIRLWDAITRMESGEHLQDVKCPTLLLCGDHDSMTLRQQKHMEEKIQLADLKMISQAHHATNLDNPDEVNAYIQGFLNKLFSVIA